MRPMCKCARAVRMLACGCGMRHVRRFASPLELTLALVEFADHSGGWPIFAAEGGLPNVRQTHTERSRGKGSAAKTV